MKEDKKKIMSAFDLKQHWDSRQTQGAVGLQGPPKETL